MLRRFRFAAKVAPLTSYHRTSRGATVSWGNARKPKHGEMSATSHDREGESKNQLTLKKRPAFSRTFFKKTERLLLNASKRPCRGGTRINHDQLNPAIFPHRAIIRILGCLQAAL